MLGADQGTPQKKSMSAKQSQAKGRDSITTVPPSGKSAKKKKKHIHYQIEGYVEQIA